MLSGYQSRARVSSCISGVQRGGIARIPNICWTGYDATDVINPRAKNRVDVSLGTCLVGFGHSKGECFVSRVASSDSDPFRKHQKLL